jgi:hypothetical protein
MAFSLAILHSDPWTHVDQTELNFKGGHMQRNPILRTLVLTMLVGSAIAQGPAGPRRPSEVPANYVITPFGYFHPSCVMHLRQGDEVQRDAKVIQHTDGSNEAIALCAYPHFTGDGTRVAEEERSTFPDTTHSWVEYASVATRNAYGQLEANWNVPPAPRTNDNQTVYLFPGLEDISDTVTILQPVLGWNADFAGAWGIASWNCCVTGTTFEGTPQRANSGDVVYGNIYNACPNGRTKTCSQWNVYTYDLTNGNVSALTNTSNFGQTFNWAFGGVLEVYNVVQCNDYPANESISFYNVLLYNYRFELFGEPGWTVTNVSGLSPLCNYGGSLTKQVNLTY